MKEKNKKRRINPVKLKLKLSKNDLNSGILQNPSLRIKLTAKQYDSKQEKENISNINQEILSYLKKHSKTDEKNILAPFNTIPSRKLYSDYYLVIKDPESIKGIQEKIINNMIKSKQELIDRYILLFENAIEYNSPESILHSDATYLLQLVMDYKSIKKVKQSENITEMKGIFDAVEGNQLEIVKKLCESLKPNVNQFFSSNTNSSWSLIHCASYFGMDSILVYLMDTYDGNVESKDPIHQGTALAWAAFGLNISTCTLLITRYIADVSSINAQGLTSFDLVMANSDSHGSISEWKQVLNIQQGLGIDQHRAKLVLFQLLSLKHGKQSICELFLTLPSRTEYPDYYQIIQKPICINDILEKIHNSSYTIDMFISHIGLLIHNTQTYNEPGSMVYQNASFIKEALLYWMGDSYSDRLSKISILEDIDKSSDLTHVSNISRTRNGTQITEYSHNGAIYHPGDIVLLLSENNQGKPIICHIARFWKDKKDDVHLTGTWYLYPEQTFHLPSRKFFEMEVFKTKTLHDHSANHILRKCMVLPWSEYRKGCPEGFSASDVFVCDFKYSDSGRQMEKMKNWTKVTRIDLNELKLIPWAIPRHSIRAVPSVFCSITDKIASIPVHQYQRYDPNLTIEISTPKPIIVPCEESMIKSFCKIPNVLLSDSQTLNDDKHKYLVILRSQNKSCICYALVAPYGMDSLYLFIDKSWRSNLDNESDAVQQAGTDSAEYLYKSIKLGWIFTEMVFHNVSHRITPISDPAQLWNEQWICFPITLQNGLNVIELFTVNQPSIQPKTGQIVIEANKHVQLAIRLFVTKMTIK